MMKAYRLRAAQATHAAPAAPQATGRALLVLVAALATVAAVAPRGAAAQERQAPRAAAAGPTAPAAAAIQPAAAAGAASAPVAAPGAVPGAGERADRADLERTQIIGNRELPKVLYIVPWKRPLNGNMGGRAVNGVVDEALSPIDREVLRRQVSYDLQLRAAVAGPAPSPKQP